MMQKKVNNDNVNLLEGAEIILAEFRTPAKLLEFLLEALSWVSMEGSSKEKGADRILFVKQLIEEIYIKWAKNVNDPVAGISKGLKKISEDTGADYFFRGIQTITQGFSLHSMQGSCFPAYGKLYLNGVNTLKEVGYCLKAYEDRRLSKAA